MSDSDDPTDIFEWTPPTAGATWPSDATLDRVQALIEERAAAADDLTRRLAGVVRDWLIAPSTPDAGVLESLFLELEPFFDAHAWRGTVARFQSALRAVGEARPDDGTPALRESLAAECAFWTSTTEASDWEGEVLAPGARVGEKARCAAPLLEGAGGMAKGETVLVHGWSETVVRGLEFAHARGLAPRAIVSEGGPDLGGRRLARRLVASGIPVRFVYDAALVECVDAVDRIWLGSDAVGSRSFIGRIGTHAALARARAADVPSAVIATTDKFMRADRLERPRWAALEPWHLWESAPPDVTVDSQSFEEVPAGLVGAFATEKGAYPPARIDELASIAIAPRRAVGTGT